MTTPSTPETEKKEEKPEFNELQEKRIQEAANSGPLAFRIFAMKSSLKIRATTGMRSSKFNEITIARNYYGCTGRTSAEMYPQIEKMAEEVKKRVRQGRSGTAEPQGRGQQEA